MIEVCFPQNTQRYVVTGVDSVAQECHLGGRFFPFFCSDIFNVVGFHLCTSHLISAKLLPQIPIPLTSVMNRKKGRSWKELSFNQGGKNFPRVSQIFHYILLAQIGSHDHLQRKGWKNIWTRKKEKHERPRKIMTTPRGWAYCCLKQSKCSQQIRGIT